MSDSIFPNLNIDLQNQIDNINIKTYAQLGKTFLFDFAKGEFTTKNGKLIIASEIKALENWIEKVIKTEKFKFKIYATGETDEYGITLEDLVIGNKFGKIYIESEIKREVTDALLKHPMILNVDNWVFGRNKNVLTINFTVNLKDGTTVEQEVIV